MLKGFMNSMQTVPAREPQDLFRGTVAFSPCSSNGLSSKHSRANGGHIHRRTRRVKKAATPPSIKYDHITISLSNSNSTSRRREALPRSEWTAMKPSHHEVRRVAKSPFAQQDEPLEKTSINNSPTWAHALFINGRVYYPRDPGFCDRVAAAARASLDHPSTMMSLVPMCSPSIPKEYAPVSTLYRTALENNSPHQYSSDRTTTRTSSSSSSSVARLKHELDLTRLREDYRRFIEDMRTHHTEREEYDPTKPYYDRSHCDVVMDEEESLPLGEEYDPENPWY